ncbi:MAG: TatD family hydrolase, partial [Candidatus ainarchaeum sp.]|nr:TatD family hydrolase [Candidatus ainarchaeum sp.]
MINNKLGNYLFDVHAHIDMIEEKNIEKLLEKIREANIKKIISCSTSFESNKKNLFLSKKYDEIECALGIYPLNIIELNEEEIDKAFNFLKKNISKAIAIGEIGLDFKYSKNKLEQEKQIKIFERFIEL